MIRKQRSKNFVLQFYDASLNKLHVFYFTFRLKVPILEHKVVLGVEESRVRLMNGDMVIAPR